MNAATNYPEIFSGYAPSVGTQTAAPDLQIKLSSNSDFDDALKQVMHVAELSQANISRAPMRVEMELQTPPGAIVNVYVSKQSDGWRAQLSTNDPAALSWVQDKMSSIKSSGSDLGINVRWLPPQIETSISTTGSSGSNLSWENNNQNQSGYQQDEQSQSNRQKKQELVPAFATGDEDDFFSALTGVGSAS